MQNFITYALAIILIFTVPTYDLHASENGSILNKSQITITTKYAERFCNAKNANFFEGLSNEKTLKYSYFKYIGLQSEEIVLNDMYNSLIQEIREKCHINTEEEREINEFFFEESES